MRKRPLLTCACSFLVIGGLAAAIFLPGCTIATSFKGPGYSADEGVVLDGAGDTVIVSLTHAELGDEARDTFRERSAEVVDQLESNPGLIAWSVRVEVFGDNLWTMTVWSDAASLNDFVYSKTHRRAMRDGDPAVKSGRFYNFEMAASELPLAWDDALRLLDEAEADGAVIYHHSVDVARE